MIITSLNQVTAPQNHLGEVLRADSPPLRLSRLTSRHICPYPVVPLQVLLEPVPEQQRAPCGTSRAAPHAQPTEIARGDPSLDESFGSQISAKQQKVLWIGFQNIDGFPS